MGLSVHGFKPTDFEQMQSENDYGSTETMNYSGASGLGAPNNFDGGWVPIGVNVQIYVPFRKYNSDGGRYIIPKYLYNNRWYTIQELMRVWNPIRQLPSWAR
jgi:hypothetical protein